LTALVWIKAGRGGIGIGLPGPIIEIAELRRGRDAATPIRALQTPPARGVEFAPHSHGPLSHSVAAGSISYTIGPVKERCQISKKTFAAIAAGQILGNLPTLGSLT
jgi:hypothetical protein